MDLREITAGKGIPTNLCACIHEQQLEWDRYLPELIGLNKDEVLLAAAGMEGEIVLARIFQYTMCLKLSKR